MANAAAFSRIDGLEDGRPAFAVVSFEGVLSVSGEGEIFFRVQTHLLRYILFHVDGTLPRFRRLRDPFRDPFNSKPVDDFDDEPRAYA